MCQWCQDRYIFPQHCTLQENIIPWENMNLLAVHRNVIYLNNLWYEKEYDKTYMLTCSVISNFVILIVNYVIKEMSRIVTRDLNYTPKYRRILLGQNSSNKKSLHGQKFTPLTPSSWYNSSTCPPPPPPQPPPKGVHIWMIMFWFLAPMILLFLVCAKSLTVEV